MSLATFCLTMFFAVGVYAVGTHLELRRKKAQGCQWLSKVNVAVVHKMVNGVFDDDVRLKEYLFCVSKTFGVMSPSGDFQNNNLKKMLEASDYKEDEISNIVRNCTEKKSSPQETVFQFMKCAFESSLRERK